MKIYTAWGKKGFAFTLVEGINRPSYINGTPIADCEEIIFKIQALTWEEAMAIYNLRMGFEPYKPAGNPETCPLCGSTYYPSGSGECWKCSTL